MPILCHLPLLICQLSQLCQLCPLCHTVLVLILILPQFERAYSSRLLRISYFTPFSHISPHLLHVSLVVYLFKLKWPDTDSTNHLQPPRGILLGPNSSNRHFCIFSLLFSPDGQYLTCGLFFYLSISLDIYSSYLFIFIHTSIS